MTSTSHLNALELRLSNERNYLAQSKSDDEKKLRKVWISQIEKEIAREYEFLGKRTTETPNLTDDELLAELFA